MEVTYGPRYREKIESTDSSYLTFQESLNKVTGKTARSVFGPYVYRSDLKSFKMDDYVLPDYQERLDKGVLLPINSMRKVEYVEKLVPSLLQYKTGIKPGVSTLVTTQTEGNFFKYLSYPTLAPLDQEKLAKLTLDARLSALSKVDSSKVLLLASLAELASTRDMLVKAGKTALKICKKIKSLGKTLKEIKLYPKSHGDLLKTAENTWMEIRMGWMPFFGEVTAIHDAITNPSEYPWLQTFRGFATFQNTIEKTGTYAWQTNKFYVPWKTSVSYEAIATVGVVCKKKKLGWPDTYGLTKFPQTMWELTPCSWVFDYFFNIGDNIAAMTPDPLWEIAQVWSKLKIARTDRATFSSGGYWHPYWSINFGGPGVRGGSLTRTDITTTRDEISADRSSALHINFDSGISWDRWIDTSIVFRQQFSKAVKKTVNLFQGSSKKVRRRLNVK